MVGSLIACPHCPHMYVEGEHHRCPPGSGPQPLAGVDVQRDLSPRQREGRACVLCRAGLRRRPARLLATVRGYRLMACAPACEDHS
ncbi:hypothetical protein [Streptomyces marincola]|uniref:hypothetical protein n=1 Tax=Streptomyces marincola TaxID=2878388 RepID=UPI001CF5A19F|nr:hypothetical protein [Streptomyces marincola]UCM87911.1 hypothetical protein LC193_08045 [Streptomyces marincola]